jgi:ferrochelatase
VTTGVLIMAHGTPASPDEIAAFYTRIRRGRPPDAAQLAELE